MGPLKLLGRAVRGAFSTEEVNRGSKSKELRLRGELCGDHGFALVEALDHASKHHEILSRSLPEDNGSAT